MAHRDAERAALDDAHPRLDPAARHASGGCGEKPIPTFPAAGFVDAGGVALLLDRASEYELVDGGRELAVTLLRSVGRLSRNVHPNRTEPAGPQVETPDAQCLGESGTSLAVLAHRNTWHADGVLAAAEQWSHDIVDAPATGAATAPEPADLCTAGLQVEGEGVVMSSLRRRNDWLELRACRREPECDKLGQGRLADVFDSMPCRQPPAHGVLLVVGPGAARVAHDVLWYADLPKRYAETAVTSGRGRDLGQWPGDGEATTKRLFCIDSPLLDRHRGTIGSAIGRIVDTQNPDTREAQSALYK